MRELILPLIKAVVDEPDQVVVREFSGEETVVFEIRVAKADVGHVIGMEGRFARALRVIFGTIGSRRGLRVKIEVLE